MAERLHDLLDAGQGIVFLHHALAGWPGWPAWAEVLGGRYHYAPAELRGQCWPDSGFRYAEYTARVVDADHPVCAGVDDFALADELYCCPVFEADVVPLLRADAPVGPFRETFHEVLGTPRTGPPWTHPPASDLIAWATSAGAEPDRLRPTRRRRADLRRPDLPPARGQRPRVGGTSRRSRVGG